MKLIKFKADDRDFFLNPEKVISIECVRQESGFFFKIHFGSEFYISSPMFQDFQTCQKNISKLCENLNITQQEEYALCHDFDDDEEEQEFNDQLSYDIRHGKNHAE